MYIIKHKSQLLSFLLLACVLTYGILVNSAFPYLGFSVAASILATTIFAQKKHKDLYIKLLYACSMVLSVCIFWRANEVLTFFNVIAVVGLTSVLAIEDDDDKMLSIASMLFSPLILLSRSLSTKIEYAITVNQEKVAGFLHRLKFQESFVSIVVTAIALAVIVPLLAGSNPFFKNLVDETFALANISQLLEKFFTLEITNWTFFQLGVLGFLLIFLPRMFGYLAKQVKSKSSSPVVEHVMLLPKFAIAAVLVIFFATQVQLYFASDAQLLAVGSTPSERTNEVFGQLSVVAGVIIGLLHFFRSYKSLDKKITMVLLIETVFLTAIAFSSVYQYAANFGFTFKRLWGLGVVFWLLAVLGIYTNVYIRRMASGHFLRAVLVVSAVALFLANVSNFDYLIANVYPPRTGAGTDYVYMLNSVSMDADAYPLLLTAFEDEAKRQQDPSAISFALYNRNRVNFKIIELQEKYTDIDLRTLNVGQYRAYKSVQQYDAQADIQRVEFLGLGITEE